MTTPTEAMDPLERRLRQLSGLPRAPKQELSPSAKLLLAMLKAGPVDLADAMLLTTSPDELHQWADELADAGYPVQVERNGDGTVYTLALKLKPLIAAKAKEKQKAAGGALPQISAKAPIDTRAQVAKAAGVSHELSQNLTGGVRR